MIEKEDCRGISKQIYRRSLKSTTKKRDHTEGSDVDNHTRYQDEMQVFVIDASQQADCSKLLWDYSQTM